MSAHASNDFLANYDGLPISPLVSSRLFESSLEAGADFGEVVRIIQTDQALSLRILKIVNSPFYGLRAKINTLSHALAMLGSRAVDTIIRGEDRYRTNPVPEGRETIDKYFFWQHALTTAVIAEAISHHLGYDIPEEAYLAGLLHDMGKILLEMKDPEAYGVVARDMSKNEDPVPVIEHRLFGAHHAEVGGLMARHWNLPGTLEAAILHHHTPLEEAQALGIDRKSSELAAIVTYADFIAWSQGLGSVENGHIPVHNTPPKHIINMLQSCLEGIMDEVNRRLRAVGEIFHLKTSGIYDFNAVFREHLPQQRAGRTQAELLEEQIEGLSALNEIIREIRRLEREDKILNTMMRGIHDKLGFDRVIHFRLNRANNEVVGHRRVDSTEIPVDISKVGFVLGIDEEGISRALTTQRPVRLTREGHDVKVLDFLGVSEVIAVPILVDERAHGVILVDAFLSGRPTTPEHVEALGLVCLEAGMAVENRQLISRSKELQELADKDELTAVSNRRFAIQMCRQELERAEQDHNPLSIVMIDIDHFKLFNDTYGHQAGDFVLREVAKRIEATSRKSDVIGRYGGEEFLVLLPDTPLERSIVYAERLRAAIEDYGKEITQIFPDCTLTISVGVTTLKQPGGEKIEEFLGRVDKALYSAKERGRNRVCVDQ
ncbi:MAG: diguanylate cyclase [Planctomycetes bacterium]|nr:diguanylate cyclase [Planctomycetota bacterium]